ncbi:protein-L-isoaspartate O-methyltransferase [Bradyrhizobium sp. GM0.4]
MPEVEGSKPSKKQFKAYPIGYFHINIAELQTAEAKLYLYFPIDRTSKFAFVQLVKKAERTSASAFLEALIAAVPYRLHTVLTDNGMPSFWARNFDHLNIAAGEQVLQVGAGTGYYSAVLAEIVGPAGRVTAIETDTELASRARVNLESWPQVDVVSGDGRAVDVGELDIAIVFAGATHPSRVWLDRLVEGGRLLMPMTDDTWKGFLLHVVRRRDHFEASSIGAVSIYPCTGGRDEDAARRLHNAIDPLPLRNLPLRALHVGEPRFNDSENVWFSGPGFWLERDPPC